MANILKISVLLACLASLAGCSKDSRCDGEENQLITFSPAASSVSTKAEEDIVGIIQNSVFPTSRTFAMTTFRMNFDASGNPTMEGGYLFMNMETVSYNSTDKGWHTAKPHYWPLSGGLYCLGFCPAPAVLMANKMLGGMDADHHGNLLFKGIDIKHVDASNNPITDDADKTDANLNHAKIDLMTSTTIIDDAQKRVSNSVPVNFTHALAQIKFSVECAKDYSSYTFYEKVGTAPNDTNWYWTHWQQFWLDEIKISNVYSKGTYSFNTSQWPGDKHSDLYTYYPLKRESRGGTQVLYKVGESGDPGDKAEDRQHFGTRTPVRTQVTSDGTNPLCILLIPQTVPDNATIEIKLTSRTANVLTADKEVSSHMMNDVVRTVKKTFKLKDLIPFLTSANCININFTLTLEEIAVGVEYEDWEDGGSQEFVI